GPSLRGSAVQSNVMFNPLDAPIQLLEAAIHLVGTALEDRNVSGDSVDLDFQAPEPLIRFVEPLIRFVEPLIRFPQPGDQHSVAFDERPDLRIDVLEKHVGPMDLFIAHRHVSMVAKRASAVNATSRRRCRNPSHALWSYRRSCAVVVAACGSHMPSELDTQV